MTTPTAPRPVLAFAPDLFFAAKIAAVAEAAGTPLEILDAGAILRRCAGEAPAPAPAPLVIVDLGAGPAALELARSLRAGAPAGLRLVGFYPHVDAALRDAAIGAGVDPVLPRSAFVARLPALLAGA